MGNHDSSKDKAIGQNNRYDYRNFAYAWFTIATVASFCYMLYKKYHRDTAIAVDLRDAEVSEPLRGVTKDSRRSDSVSRRSTL